MYVLFCTLLLINFILLGGFTIAFFGFRSPLIFFLTDWTSNVKVGSNFTPHIVHTTQDQQASQAGPPAGTNGWDTDSENLNSLLDSLEPA
jgi:hypothetical protein